jgi:Flp pilus assembly protein TadB
MPEVREDRTLGELFGQLSQDMTLLVRQELQLAKAELTDKANRAKRDAVAAGTGGLVAYIGALALVAAVILFLTQVVGITAWLSALLVGAALAIGGFVVLRRGARDLGRIDPTPRRTVESVQEDIQWVKEQRP